MDLWDIDTEKRFFREALLRDFASPEKSFYSLKSGKVAYAIRDCDAERQTLQSRNALIGNFTETWAKKIFDPIAQNSIMVSQNKSGEYIRIAYKEQLMKQSRKVLVID